jgi:periplasmic protein TonB
MRTTASFGVLASVLLHGSIGVALWALNPASLVPRQRDILELEVIEPPPPPLPPPEPLPPPPSEPPPPEPRKIPPKAVAKPPPETEPLPPPPPNQEPPAEPPDEPPPPVFGVTLDSVVTGESAVAVPVGNTLMTKERKPARPGPPPPPLPASEPGAPAFSPVSDIFIGEYPKLLQETKPHYPEEARRLGIEGQVTMRVGVDRKGQVRSVKVVRGVGHGLEAAAVKAMWKFKFSPCRTKDGEAVDCMITYRHTFQTD